MAPKCDTVPVVRRIKLWIIAAPCRKSGRFPPQNYGVAPVKNLILSLGIASTLLVAACGKKEEAAAPAADAAAPAATTPVATDAAAPAAAPATTDAAATEKKEEAPKQ